MTITLYNTSSENNAIHKSLGTGSQYTGSIRDTGAVDVVRPEILIASNVYGYNYAYIPDFGRYYFIIEITQDRTGLSTVRLKSDPLMSFQSDVLALPAIALRAQQNAKQSPYLIDPRQRLQAYKRVQTVSMGTLTMSSLYLLVTAG